jgi:hypothetical protein
MLAVEPSKMDKIRHAIGDAFSCAYLISPMGIHFADKLFNTCTTFSLTSSEFAMLKEALKIEDRLQALTEDCPIKRNKTAMTAMQLRLISEVTKHSPPASDLNEILIDLLRISMSYEQWQEYIGNKQNLSDERLYHFVLGLDVNSYDSSKKLLAAAANKIDEIQRRGVKIPENAVDDRAYLFCLEEVYKRVREQGPEYESMISSIASEKYSKTKRLEYCELYKRFITSDYKLNEFDEFLKKMTAPLRQRSFFPQGETMLRLKNDILIGFIKAVHDCTKKRGNELDRLAAIRAAEQNPDVKPRMEARSGWLW